MNRLCLVAPYKDRVKFFSNPEYFNFSWKNIYLKIGVGSFLFSNFSKPVMHISIL